MNIRKVLKAAVGQVMKQVRPQSARPCHGNSDTVTTDLLPVVRKFFNVKKKLKAGSEEHQKFLIKHDSYTLQHCVLFPLVMEHHVKMSKYLAS